jgi:hypothetical protein
VGFLSGYEGVRIGAGHWHKIKKARQIALPSNDRYHANRAWRRRGAPKETLSDFFGLVTSMPRDLVRLVKDARHGRMRVDLDLKRLDSFGHRLHSAINRVTIGIMTHRSWSVPLL